MLSIAIVSGQGETLLSKSGASPLSLYYAQAYQSGDEVVVRSDSADRLTVRLDSLAEADVYAPSGEMRYLIPFGEAAKAYPPQCFSGEKHVIEAAEMPPKQVFRYRNLALNPLDQRREANVFPHATANVETRGESVFAARNVIDGFRLNEGHGEWPFQSWGIGARTDAWLTVWFGRTVLVDAMTFYLRADFPHDAHWVRASVAMSDGSEETFSFKRTGAAQHFPFPPRKVEWIRLFRLIKSDEPSAFPALTEWEIHGSDV